MLASGRCCFSREQHAAAGEVAERTFALVIGYNGQPPGATDESIQPLHYADDDALAFYAAAEGAGRGSDPADGPGRGDPAALSADRGRRAPADDGRDRPRHRRAERAHGRGRARTGATPVFVFFYSGHGSRDFKGDAAFALLDGTLSQTAMHERVLDKIRSPVIHLIIDACHAEAVVRPRDIEAKTVEIRPEDLVEHLSKTSSARYPNVGLVVASSSGASTHEWDIYQSGVFTHEVISGLRGVADVNHDGRVEYGELAAFLTAANREVIDPRARVSSIIQAPATGAHEALSRIGARSTIGWLTGIPPTAGRLLHRGPPRQPDPRRTRRARILDIGRRTARRAAVPAQPRRGSGAGREGRRGGAVQRARVPPAPAASAGRDGDIASRRVVPDAVRARLLRRLRRQVGRPAPTRRPRSRSSGSPPNRAHRLDAARRLGGDAGDLRRSSACSPGSARSDFENTVFQRQANDANDRFKLDTTLAISFAISGVLCAAASYLVGLRK